MVRENKTECKMTFRNEEPHVNKCFPRVRGDVPSCANLVSSNGMFSPRARGCSELFVNPIIDYCVFPACAGMFLGAQNIKVSDSSFPRVRGDVPPKIGGNR